MPDSIFHMLPNAGACRRAAGVATLSLLLLQAAGLSTGRAGIDFKSSAWRVGVAPTSANPWVYTVDGLGLWPMGGMDDMVEKSYSVDEEADDPPFAPSYAGADAAPFVGDAPEFQDLPPVNEDDPTAMTKLGAVSVHKAPCAAGSDSCIRARQEKYEGSSYNVTEWDAAGPPRGPEAPRAASAPAEDDSVANPRNNLCTDGHLVPELLVIGTLKAGTTSLSVELRRSKDIVWSSRQSAKGTNLYGFWKEAHFFDWNRGRGKTFMEESLPECQTQVRKVAVDATPGYMLDKDIPYVISSWYGEKRHSVKFVVVLRDPLMRLHSHYYHSQRDNWCEWHKAPRKHSRAPR